MYRVLNHVVSKNKLISIVRKVAIVAMCFVTFLINANTSTDFTSDEFKAALVGHVLKNIEWSQKSNSKNFSIKVYGSKDDLNMLSVLKSIELKGKPVTVEAVRNPKQALEAHAVYIGQSNNEQLSEWVSQLRNSNTLLITDNSPSRHNVMINLIETTHQEQDTKQYSFQINRPNLAFEKLTTLPNLVLYGGTELDVAELYHETESAIQSLKEENQLVFDQLTLQNELLLAKEQELEELENKSKSYSMRLADQQRQLQSSADHLSSLSAKVDKANERVQNAEQEIQDKEKELVKAAKHLAIQQEAVASQRNILEQLKSQVKENAVLLVEQSDLLATKESEVNSQAELIQKQNQIILIVSILVAAALIFLFLITKLFFKNRRINAELKQTLTTLEQTQSQLVESEKMASLGNLVAGVAHELNTPLGISITAVSTIGDDAARFEDLLEQQKLKKSDITNFLEKLKDLDHLIRSNLERCHQLIQSFKQISSDQVVAENREVSLRDYVAEVMRSLSVLLKQHKVTYTIEGDNPQVVLDPGILNQVINNLTTNAVGHAFEGKEDKHIHIQISTVDERIEILFVDNGVGMDDRTKELIFEPFFTTKRGQGGTGLGMNIVHNLVTSKLGGQIALETSVGEGTRFKIDMPKCA